MRNLLRLILFVAVLLGGLWLWQERDRVRHAVDVAREAVDPGYKRDAPSRSGVVIDVRDEGSAEDARRRVAEAGDAPAPEPGSALFVELTEPPAARYGPQPLSEADLHYARLAEKRHSALIYEPALGHAARELAAFHALEGKLAPDPVLTFFLDAGGAFEWGVEQTIRVTSSEGDTPIQDQLAHIAESVPRGERVRIGVGETWTLSRPARRHIAVLISRGGLLLDAVPRSVRAGQTVEIGGQLPAGVGDVDVLVMGPDLVVTEVEARSLARRFSAEIPAGRDPGSMLVEIIADGPQGPKPLAQLDLLVESELPEVLETAWPPDESHLQNTSDAEDTAWRLINADRARFGLPALPRSETLDAVARGHSIDMRDHGFFGHVSPTTGSVTDRLEAVRMKTVLHAENIARNDTLFDAEVGLMRSIGHRRNILHVGVTEVGVGVASTDRGDKRQWTLTQVFGKPSPVIDAEVARRAVLRALREARRDAELRVLKEDEDLDDVAWNESLRHTPTPRRALDAAEGHLRRGGWAWVARVHELEGLEIPEEVLDRDYRRVGLSVRQDTGREGPDIVIVLVVGG